MKRITLIVGFLALGLVPGANAGVLRYGAKEAKVGAVVAKHDAVVTVKAVAHASVAAAKFVKWVVW